MLRLQQESYSGGFNDRDDPHSIGLNQAQTLVNAYPGNPAPRVREGTGLFNGSVDDSIGWPGLVKELFEFKDDIGGHKVIAQIGRSLYWCAAGRGQPQIIGLATLLPSSSIDMYCERVFDSLFFVGNWPSEDVAFIVEWDGGGFGVRNANIAPPELDPPVNNLWSPSNKGSFDFAFSEVAEGLQDAHYYVYAVTFSNIGGTDESDAFDPGYLESFDNLDRRVIYLTGASAHQLALDISIDFGDVAIDPQVTHVNIYRTQGVDSSAEGALDIAKGLPPKFLVSIPLIRIVANVLEFTDSVSDDVLSGETNTIEPLVGKSPMPSGMAIKYHAGYMWVGGVRSGGRWYHSSTIASIERPLKFLSAFDYSTQFADTSLDNGDSNSVMGVAGNDLFFVMRQSLHRLRDGDINFAPELVSSTQGTRFPRSLTEINKRIYYLSNEGPAAIYGTSVELLNAFTAGALWPDTYAGAGAFHQLGVAGTEYEGFNPDDVLGFFFKNCYFVSHMDETYGMMLAPDQRTQGPWKLEFGNPILRIGSVAVLSDTLAVFTCKPDVSYYSGQADPEAASSAFDSRSWKLLDNAATKDAMVVFTFSTKSRAIYANSRKRDQTAEALDVRVFAGFSDPGELRVRIQSDYVRHAKTFLYNQRRKPNALQNQEIADDRSGGREGLTKWRNCLQQGFPEGIYGHYFEVTITKRIFPPFDFYFLGFDLQVILRPGQPLEFVSTNLGTDDVPLDAGYLARVQPIELTAGVSTWSVEEDAGEGIFTVQGSLDSNP